jgi:hypothetical protein
VGDKRERAEADQTLQERRPVQTRTVDLSFAMDIVS